MSCARENGPPQMHARQSPNRFLPDLDVGCTSDQEGWRRVRAARGTEGGGGGLYQKPCSKTTLAMARPKAVWSLGPPSPRYSMMM